MYSLEKARAQGSSAPPPLKSCANTRQISAPKAPISAPSRARMRSLRLEAREMRLFSLPAVSSGVVETQFSARSRRYPWRVRVAIAWNFSDLCAAFSALMILASRKARKAAGSRNVRPFEGSGGPNGGTSLILVTATLQEKKRVCYLFPPIPAGFSLTELHFHNTSQ